MESAKAVDTCWICGSSISIEMCTFDVEGLPVHGPCLTAMLVLSARIKPARNSKEPMAVVSQSHNQKVLS